MIRSTTTVATPQARQYLFKLCKHFAKKIPAEFDEARENGHAAFPFGDCTFAAGDEALTLTLAAPDAETHARLTSVIEDHLNLMRRLDDARLDWQAM
ncbi:DUF2218 domain-containing protein [Chitinibacteraceae bacterium HSL-7]